MKMISVSRRNFISNYIGLESIISRGLFALSIFFIYSLAIEAKTLKIAIFDTGFCISKIKISKQIKIFKPTNVTGFSKNLDCTKIKSDRHHGHHVLETFLSELNIEDSLEIYPVVVFDDKGIQKAKYWQMALDIVKERAVDALLLAASLPLTIHSEIKLKVPSIAAIFVASGSVGRGIRKNTPLWPQVMAPRKNIFVIGSYITSQVSGKAIYDNSLINNDKIDLYFDGGSVHSSLRGSSRAVSIALARSINKCQLKHELRKCLKSNRVSVAFKSRLFSVGYTLQK